VRRLGAEGRRSRRKPPLLPPSSSRRTRAPVSEPGAFPVSDANVSGASAPCVCIYRQTDPRHQRCLFINGSIDQFVNARNKVPLHDTRRLSIP
jgi:hypothetical protein